MFSTIVAAAGNGTEQRLPQWSAPRYKWNIGAGLKNPTDFLVVFNFWINRKGKAHGFRLKDWDDYQATDELLVPDGTPYTQLIKTYSDTLLSYIRNIYKPVSGTVTLKRNSVSYTTFTLDTTTGVISHTALILKSITGITQAASAVVTVGSGHGFVIGDVVYITGVSGMTEINDATYTVTATATTTITLNVDSTGFTAYTSGGTCGKYVQPTDTLTWTGEFDVPVRFDIDEPQMVLEDVAARSWDNIPVIELRGSS